MSIELLLIPVGLTIYAAIKEHRRTDLCAECRATTVTDLDLLTRALAQIGVTEIEVHDGSWVTGRFGADTVRFQLIDGTIVGRVDGKVGQETDALLQRVNAAAGLVSQNDSVEAMRVRATELGLQLVSEERAEDGTVQLLFEEVTDG